MRAFGALLAPLVLAAAPCAAQETLLIGNKGEDTLSFVDVATSRELRRVPTGPMPHEIAVSPDGARAAVVAYGGRTIEVFDLATAARLETIDLGAGARPHGIVWLADGRIVAAAEGIDSLLVVGTGERRTIRRIATAQEGSHMVAVSPDRTRAYVTNMKSASVGVFDLARGRKLRDLAVGGEPEGLALSPDGRRLWIADRGGATVQVFDAATLAPLAKLATGKTPIRVAISPDGQYAITSNFGAGTLSLFSARDLKPIRTIPVSGRAEAQQVTLLFAPDGRRVYVAETGDDRVAVVDMASGRILARLPAGRQGDGLALSGIHPAEPR